MAENKKSFLLYADTIHTVEKLTDDKAGQLFKHLLRYVNDQHPTTEDFIIELAFEPIKQQLKRDLKNWEDRKQKRSEAGKRGGEATAIKQQQNTAKHSNAKQDEANKAVSDSVSDSVSDNVNTMYLLPMMQDVFLKTNTDYPQNIAKDYEALREIVEQIALLFKLKFDLENEKTKTTILDFWKTFSLFIMQDDFLKNYSLHQISKHFQSIIQKQKNGLKKIIRTVADTSKSGSTRTAL